MLTVSNPFSSHVIINIPRLCKSVNIMIDFNETISEFIDRVLEQVGIKEKENYKLYAVSRNFLELPSDSLCSSFFFTFYDSLLLLGKDDIQIITSTIYYENKKSSIAIEGSSEISYLVSIAARLLKLPIGQTYYLMFNPITNELYPLDFPVSFNLTRPEFQNPQHKYILKPFSLFASPYIFSPTKINDKSRIQDKQQTHTSFFSQEMLPLQQVQMNFIPSTFRSVLTAVHNYVTQHKDDPVNYLKLSLLDKKKIDAIMNNYDDEYCFECLNDTETNSFLFYLLSTYNQMYITENMVKTIINIFTTENERRDEIDLFYKVSALITLLPVCTQCILLELCKCFSPISTKSDVSQLIARCFVPEVKSKSLVDFFAFVLVFYEFLFRLSDVSNKLYIIIDTNELCVIGKDDNAITIKGTISAPPKNNLNEFHFDRNIFDVIDTLISKNENELEDLNMKNFDKMNSKISTVSKLQEQKDELIKQIKQKLNE